MIHIQVISRQGENLQSLIRAAIADGRIRSFSVSRVKGGLRLQHRSNDIKGEVRLAKSAGPLLVTLVSKNRSKEFRILEAFIGRLAYHFKNEISSINIQLEPEE
jgi:hypothetical protein